jgi:iron complex outermembrane receptor protein
VKHRSLTLAWLAGSGIAATLGSSLATAAETSEGAQSELLQEIVVYGRARDETTLDVPQSVDVFNAEMLEAIGSDRIGDALRFVPGASSDGSKLDAFGDSYLIRGFGADQTVNGIGVNQLNHSRDAVSVERIEVLKGPASVLYGQLQPGAVVNVVTKQPERDFGAQIGLEAGRYDFYRGTLDVTGPLSKSGAARFRLTAALEDSDAFVDFWGKKHVFVSPVLAFDAGENTTVTLEALYSKDDWTAFFNGVPAEGTVLPNPNGPLPKRRGLADPTWDGTVRENTDVNVRLEHVFNDDVAYRGSVSWTNGTEDYEEIFGVLGWDESEDASFAENRRNLLRALLATDSDADTYFTHHDVSVAFNTGRFEHELVVGADWRKTDETSRDVASLVPSLDLYAPVYGLSERPPILFEIYDNDSNRTVESYGAFLQDRIALTEKLRFIGAARYSEVDQTLEFTPVGESTEISDQTTDKWTSQLGLLYSVNDRMSVFASRTTSFVPVLGTVFGGRPLDPETGTQYELGVKAAFDRLSLTVAAFDVTRADVAVADRENPGFNISIGEQTARGVEVSVDTRITDAWRLYAAYAYTDTEVTEDTEGTKGNTLRNVPKNTFALITQYDLESMLPGFSLGANLNFVDQRPGDIQNSFELPSHWQLDLNAAYRYSDRVSVRLQLDNATDEDIYSVAWSTAEVWPGAPRTWRVSVSTRL